MLFPVLTGWLVNRISYAPVFTVAAAMRRSDASRVSARSAVTARYVVIGPAPPLRKSLFLSPTQ